MATNIHLARLRTSGARSADIRRHLKPGLDVEDARADVADLLTWKPIAVTGRLIESAWVEHDRYGFSWWDSLIVAAARAAACERLLTEDMQHGQDLDGIEIVDPFRRVPT